MDPIANEREAALQAFADEAQDVLAEVESTAGAASGVSAPRPEVSVLREQIREAPSGAGYGSIDLALRSVVHRPLPEGEGEAPPERAWERP